LLTYWSENVPEVFPNYAAGSWGPEESTAFMTKDGRAWRLI